MQRVKCIISYDGSNFSGYQVQSKERTVQLELEQALSRMHKGQNIRVFASGRTDTNVHAIGQVLHFDSSLSIDSEQWKRALNSLLPGDIVIRQVELVSDQFHARFNVIKKEYRYKVQTGAERNVFNRNYVYHFPYHLDIQSMNKAIEYLVGTHDFTSFCASKTDVIDKVRTIYEVECIVNDDEIVFRFVGSGFLYNMVRILVGTILDVGQGRINPEQIPVIINKRDRKNAGKTAPGNGLYLWKVYYD